MDLSEVSIHVIGALLKVRLKCVNNVNVVWPCREWRAVPSRGRSTISGAELVWSHRSVCPCVTVCIICCVIWQAPLLTYANRLVRIGEKEPCIHTLYPLCADISAIDNGYLYGSLGDGTQARGESVSNSSRYQYFWLIRPMFSTWSDYQFNPTFVRT